MGVWRGKKKLKYREEGDRTEEEEEDEKEKRREKNIFEGGEKSMGTNTRCFSLKEGYCHQGRVFLLWGEVGHSQARSPSLWNPCSNICISLIHQHHHERKKNKQKEINLLRIILENQTLNM